MFTPTWLLRPVFLMLLRLGFQRSIAKSTACRLGLRMETWSSPTHPCPVRLRGLPAALGTEVLFDKIITCLKRHPHHLYGSPGILEDKAGRPDIDVFEAARIREHRTKGFLVSFDFRWDAVTEVDAFPRREGRVIIPPRVREIFDVEIRTRLV